MGFDGISYRETYLLPQGKLKLTALPDDLLQRYAISLPATDAEVAATVKAVRSFWSQQQAGSRAGNHARLCIGADDVLRSAHGDNMLTGKWWQGRAAEQAKAASLAAEQLGELLKETHGGLGFLTQAYLDGCATTLGLTADQATRAAREAGLTVLTGQELPSTTPIPDSQYSSFETLLATAGVPTLVHLLHPAVQPDTKQFSIVVAFAIDTQLESRLDGDAVGTQLVLAERLQPSPANDARREALRVLKTVAKATDLRELALHNLAQIARRSSSLGLAGVRNQLLKLGLMAPDAAALAVLTYESGSSQSVISPPGIKAMLAEGRLREATQATNELPNAFKEDRTELLASIAAARVRFDELVGEALAFVRSCDEIAALSRIRDAFSINADEAEQVLALIPLAPPSAVVGGVEGDSAHIHWTPSIGHSEETTYVVRRSSASAPTTVVEGTGIALSEAHRASDDTAPVARVLHYSVLATSAGRPASRAASVSVVVAPPATDLHADVGPDEVTFHWSGHPQAHRFSVTQRMPSGEHRPMRVSNNSVHLTGLLEGQPVSIEVVAEYQSPDGTVMRSDPCDISAVPRSRAQPVQILHAQPSSSGPEVNLSISWIRVDNSDVRIRRSEGPAQWGVGTWVESGEFASFGQEVTGRITTRGSEVTLESVIPEGHLHHLVAFSIGGTGIVVGASTVVGITEPVRRLEAREFASHAKITWLWPDGASQAEVVWERDSSDPEAVGVEKVKISEYERLGGFDVPLGPGKTVVEVRTLMNYSGDAAFGSQPARIEIEQSAAGTTVWYTVDSSPRLGPLGGRTKRFVFHSDSAVTNARVLIVASAGIVMPSSAEDGTVLADVHLNLAGGRPHEETVNIPKFIKRPYWVRCFSPEGSLDLIDPSLAALKEA